jgi:hypothetical protein
MGNLAIAAYDPQCQNGLFENSFAKHGQLLQDKARNRISQALSACPQIN